MANTDIADLILTEHAEFRRALADIEKLTDAGEVRRLWSALNARLEMHAAGEEEVFYPALLRKVEDSEGDTEHAVKDHNKIRQATSKVEEQVFGTDAWWDALSDARDETIEHLDEEEHDVFPPFRSDVDEATRNELGRRWLEFLDAHQGARGLSGEEKNPEAYVEEHAP